MEQLDLDELLKLSLIAIQRGAHDQALSYLKQAQALDPQHAEVLFLLGAEHAQIGLFDRAIDEIGKALEINPDLHTARFQLGLLQISGGTPDAARTTWAPLNSLGDGHFLNLFRVGLEALADNDMASARTALQAGLRANKGNPALNVDMERILASIPEGDSGSDGTRSPTESSRKPRRLSAYGLGESDGTGQ